MPVCSYCHCDCDCSSTACGLGLAAGAGRVDEVKVWLVVSFVPNYVDRSVQVSLMRRS